MPAASKIGVTASLLDQNTGGADASSPYGDALTITSFTQAGHGTVTRGPNNTLVYQPTDGFVGFDHFQYTVSDGKGGTATANVKVYVDP